LARQLIIRLEEVKNPAEGVSPWRASWLVMENGRPQGNLMRGDLSSAVPLATNSQIVALIPTEYCLLLDVNLPGRNRQRLLNAVPYAVEEQFIDDVDDLHFALSPQSIDNHYTVAAIDREKFIELQKVLDNADLHPLFMLPDVLALKHDEVNWTVLDEGERQYVRTGRYSGFVTNKDSLHTFLMASLKEAETKPRLIEVRTPAEKVYDWPESLEDIPVVKKEYDQESTVLLACEYDRMSSINLLQGEFSRRESVSKHFRPWYSVAALLALWLVWQGGLNVFHYYQLTAQNKSLKKEIDQVYRKTFPGSRRVVNATLQMRQQLKKLRQQSGKSTTSMAEMLATAAPLLMTADGLKINNLRYQDGTMDLELELKNLQALDKLKEKLNERQEWKVEIKSASNRKDKVESRLQIRSAGS